jgi:CheY-like chemotaxis protein
MLQGKIHTILLIEPDTSLRWLIALGLQHQGFHVIEASSPLTVPTLDAQQIHLLILDIDNDTQSDWSLVEAAQSHPHFTDLPTIVLSWERPITGKLRPETISTLAAATDTQTLYQMKPFDARILYTHIEQLLTTRATKEALVAAHKEEMLVAAYSAQAPSSIWPIVTAAGLLLAFVGILLQITITILGILIVIVGLLWWTLGSKKDLGAFNPAMVSLFAESKSTVQR